MSFILFKGHTVIISDSLQDEHILDLSKRITSAEELMDFGIKGLGLPDFKIKTAMYDHSDSIQAATHELLSTWLKQQTDRQEAYKNLQAGLKRAQMNQLVANLRTWVEGSGVISQTIEESKWIFGHDYKRQKPYEHLIYC